MGKRQIIVDGEVKLVAHKDLVNTTDTKPKKTSKKPQVQVLDDSEVSIESDPILSDSTPNNRDQENLTEEK